MATEAYDLSLFMQVVNDADLATPDGMPQVWVMRRSGLSAREQVYARLNDQTN
jgi:N-acetylglucosaminyldiphosphoundecaprenol N-acetyl-beta-D-mannosaminyltransferase